MPVQNCDRVADMPLYHHREEQMMKVSILDIGMHGNGMGRVCAFVFGLRNGECCRLIDALPVGGVFSLCGSDYEKCTEYQRLDSQERFLTNSGERKAA
jgi:hypothetical protein